MSTTASEHATRTKGAKGDVLVDVQGLKVHFPIKRGVKCPRFSAALIRVAALG